MAVFQCGDVVLVTRCPECDCEYTDHGKLNRKRYDGKVGEVVKAISSHNFSYAVKFPNEVIAWYEPEELSPFPPFPKKEAGIFLPFSVRSEF